MQEKILRILQDEEDSGEMQLNVYSGIGMIPIQNAVINITIENGSADMAPQQVMTDGNGRTEPVRLPAPPLQYSMQPESEEQPWNGFTLRIDADGYQPVYIEGSEVFADETSIQPVVMNPEVTSGDETRTILIGPNTLFGDYPSKIPEAEIKPVNESGEIVLSRIVVPEIIVVHDGVPTDASAQNYYVRYRDYIKNVACSEIYCTWPEETIRANVLAIMSFTLNRVYTEWYRNRGYDFTITSSTAYDHKWIYGRNIFENISQIVDQIFNQYVARPGVRQPLLTQYCDGSRVTCPQWMSQWGSKYLGDQNYSAEEILRYYYGEDIYIASAEEIAGIPSSWPGYNLETGSRGIKVEQLQQQLNAIAQAYPALPQIGVDGIYGQQTANAVRDFQRVFNMPQTGVVDFPTWYRISDIYVGVTRIAELE